MPDKVDRRPIATRSTNWAKWLASSLAAAGLTPNQVSLASVVFAIFGGILYLCAADASPSIKVFCFIAAAFCIQLRLLCNMIDGMIAVEGGKQSKLGALFNEMPDRVADSLFLVGAGYACGHGGIELGWAAALGAVLTAYIRAFAASQSLGQDFSGPMAKQHRMFVLTIVSLAAAVEAAMHWPARAMIIGLIVIIIGTFTTCVRRTWHMAKALENQRP